MLQALGDLSERSSPRSQTRKLCLSFQQELLSRAAAVPGGLAGAGKQAAGADAELISEQGVVRWLSPLPRMLWELGSMVRGAISYVLRQWLQWIINMPGHKAAWQAGFKGRGFVRAILRLQRPARRLCSSC